MNYGFKFGDIVSIQKGEHKGKKARVVGFDSLGGLKLDDLQGKKIWNGQYTGFDKSWITLN